jgi:hypothetical protein
MRNVRQLNSSQHMCIIVLVLSTRIIVPFAKLRCNFNLQYRTHLAMEGFFNLVA